MQDSNSDNPISDENPVSGPGGESPHQSRIHAPCSASSSSRWLSCPGSIYLTSISPKQKSNIYAEEGTLAHEISERYLAAWLKQKPYESKTVTPEMLEHIKKYLAHVEAKAQEFDETPNVKIETKLIFDEDLCMWGTADVAMTGKVSGRYHGKIIDLKYGKGKVEAADNSQLAYYAVALSRTSKHQLESVEVSIFQPKLPKPATSILYSKDELQSWFDKLYTGAERALWSIVDSSKRIYVRGEYCKYCPGKALCPEMNKPAPEGAGLEFSEEP